MNVYIGEPIIVDDYSAMQGPAPDGFHVPLISEWQGLKTIMDGFGLTTGPSWQTNLHMPLAGAREKYAASIYDQGSYGNYWSSSPRGDSTYLAMSLNMGPNNTNASFNHERAKALTVRCFKDIYEEPTSSWTVINGTLGSAGIFWNQTKGLISITDGTTGYTIQDKNLGATTVYNDGNTLTQANMGKMYQWGNNYGFPSTGSVTTSSTQVNAGSYGPGNYYSGSTFIYRNNDRSSVQNDNLRGGATGVVQKTVSQELKNDYIGWYFNLDYSYNLVGKSASIMQSDGWALSDVALAAFGTYGLYFNISGSGTEVCTNKESLVLGGVKTITMTMTSRPYAQNTSYYFNIGGISNISLYNTYSDRGFKIGGTSIVSTSRSTSENTQTLVFDLDNKTYSYSDTVGYTSNGSLTDTQIGYIKKSTYFNIMAGCNGYTGSGNSGLKEMSLKVVS